MSIGEFGGILFLVVAVIYLGHLAIQGFLNWMA